MRHTCKNVLKDVKNIKRTAKLRFSREIIILPILYEEYLTKI